MNFLCVVFCREIEQGGKIVVEVRDNSISIFNAKVCIYIYIFELNKIIKIY